MNHVFGPGTLAAIDSFAGLIPCKALEVEPDGRTVTVKVTAARPGYRKGETLRLDHNIVVPRSHIFTRGHILRVRGGYVWTA